MYLGGKRATGRQGKGGVATDFLFSDDSTKSFAIVEIKTPETESFTRYTEDKPAVVCTTRHTRSIHT